MQEVNISKEEFEKLLVYNLSLPTLSGTLGVKKWRKQVNNEWYIGEYDMKNQDGNSVPIIWSKAVIEQDFVESIEAVEMDVVTATVSTGLMVDCPNCGEYFNAYDELIDHYHKQEYYDLNQKVKCPSCELDFIVNKIEG